MKFLAASFIVRGMKEERPELKQINQHWPIDLYKRIEALARQRFKSGGKVTTTVIILLTDAVERAEKEN